MSRRTYLFTALALVVLSLAAPVMWTAASAQDDSAIPPDHPLIGTWRVTSTEAGEESPVIDTWSADGTVIGIDPLVFAAGPDFVVFETSALGAWEATGNDSGNFTVEYFASDGQGNFAGTVTVSGNRQVGDDGQTAAGEFAYAAFDPEGNVIAVGRGTDEATRLTVVSMDELATPAATPAT